MSEPRSLPRSWVAMALLLHLLPIATRPALIGGDEPHYALMAHSIAADGDIELDDDYGEVEAGSLAAGRKRAGEALDPHLRRVGGRQVFSHPLGLPLLVAPLLFVWERLAPGSSPDWPLVLASVTVTFAALLAGWRLAVRWSGDLREGTVLALGLYFSTPLWYYSRTFFTEPYTWAWAVLAVAALASHRFILASLMLGASLLMKETAVLLVVPILFACWALSPPSLRLKRTGAAAAGPTLFALFFVVKNLALTGRPLATFQPFQLGDPWRGALGLLVDPAKGLLWFAPFVVLAALGWGLGRPMQRQRYLAWAALGIFGGYFLVTAAWVDWRGGSCYGPRLLVPALPALAVPLASLRVQCSGRGVGVATASIFCVGFTVNWCAALHPVAAFWGASVVELLTLRPVDVLAGLFLAAVFVWRVEGPRLAARPG